MEATGRDSDAQLLPMFPLGTVLLPGMALPLRIFEPRYRQMLDDLERGAFDRTDEFGVVLIERGSEVGGVDQRGSIGCAARIVHLDRHRDGSAELIAVGDRTLAVERWLDDAPYPLAAVSHPPPPAAGPDDAEALARLCDDVATVVSLAFQLRLTDDPSLPELHDDTDRRAFQLALALPIGPADRQRVLEAPSTAQRIRLLHDMATEQGDILRAHLRP